MKRTQLYLDEDIARLLVGESRRRKTTLSALVREAIASTYGDTDRIDRKAIIRRLAGVWADRKDIGAGDAFVRGLRTSNRSQRWARGTRAKVSARHRHHHRVVAS